jgi:hypothetical protein
MDNLAANPLRASYPAPNAEFYVGYLPMPPAHAFFVRLALPFVFWLAIGAAALMSSSQTSPGDGTWATDRIVTVHGMIDASPYPLIRTPTSRLDRPFESLLLVQTGKFGASRAAPFDGRIVTLTGWMIERDGRRMLELAPGDDSLKVISATADADRQRLQRPEAIPAGRVTLRGEILDAKCYLGVMKPGSGKTHKECATLCIRGGIPPMFVTRDAANHPRYFLITNPEGAGFDPRILPFVGDPVEVTGDTAVLGDITLLELDADSIQRL